MTRMPSQAGAQASDCRSGDPDIEPGLSKVPPFHRRSMAALMRQLLHRDASAEIWINATVTGWEVNRENGRVTAAIAKHPSGTQIRVECDFFVVAAGAIETTRLLLALDLDTDTHPFAGCTALGGYFHDHISLPLATVRPHFAARPRAAQCDVCASVRRFEPSQPEAGADAGGANRGRESRARMATSACRWPKARGLRCFAIFC